MVLVCAAKGVFYLVYVSFPDGRIFLGNYLARSGCGYR